MTKIITSEDCGNSPKNTFLEKLTIAFAEDDIDFILGSVTGDIYWKIVAEKIIQGKENFSTALKQKAKDGVEELTIHHVATHGKTGAVNGTLKMKNGKNLAFCDVYEFNNAKGVSVKKSPLM